MTREEFLNKINKGRFPKYVLSQIKEGKPEKDCSAIVCTKSESILLAKYECSKWQQAHFTSATSGYPSQNIYYTDIKEDIIYWTDGKAEDRTKQKFNNRVMKLIDKDAIVAEIEKRKIIAREKTKIASDNNNVPVTAFWSGKENICNELLSFLDTLDAKEVDLENLEQEVQDFCERFDDRKESWYSMVSNDQKLMVSPTFVNFAMQIAKHFFEIGMRSTITEEDCKLIWNIGDGLPCMKEEDFFKELLRRYKAQKGE